LILHRCFAWNERARPDQPDSPLWFPRVFQGDGRHDNPDAYGCLYLTDREASAVVEQLARFRGQRLIEPMLVRRELPLALAAIELPDDAEVTDLDDPVVLRRRRLRPSLVATRERSLTQPQALAVYRDTEAAGLHWWSIFESLWANYTIFDRAGPRLALQDVRALSLADGAIAESADYLGLPIR
jgi:RES domain